MREEVNVSPRKIVDVCRKQKEFMPKPFYVPYEADEPTCWGQGWLRGWEGDGATGRRAVASVQNGSAVRLPGASRA